MQAFGSTAFNVDAYTLLAYAENVQDEELGEELSDFAHDLATISTLAITTAGIPECEQRQDNALGLLFQTS